MVDARLDEHRQDLRRFVSREQRSIEDSERQLAVLQRLIRGESLTAAEALNLDTWLGNQTQPLRETARFLILSGEDAVS